MRLSKVALAGFCGLSLLAGACNEGKLRTEEGIALVEPPIVDFGRVALGATAVREVRVRNLGRVPLSLLELGIEGLDRDVRIITHGERQLKSGREAILELRYTPEVEELLERTLSVGVDVRAEPTILVPVKGVALRPRILAEPASLDFGRIELGLRERRTLALRNEFELPVEVQLGRTGDAQFAVPLDPVLVPPFSTLVMELGYLPERPGRADGTVRLLPCPLCAEAVVPLEGVGLDRALLVDPPLLDFGNVPIDRRATRELTLANDSTHPLEIVGVATDPSHPAFQADELALHLAAGESVKLPVRFGPTRLGRDESAIEIRTSSVREPTSRIVVRGIGGGPELAVVPGALIFGEVPEGGLVTKYVRLMNVGADPGLPPLSIASVTLAGSADFQADLAAPVVLGPGEFFDLPLHYAPTAPGGANATAIVASNDGASPEMQVALSGRVTVAPPCTLELAPGRIDFGTIDEGRGAVLGFTLRNLGSTVCVLRDIRIAPGSDPVFRMPGVPLAGFLLPPGDWFGRMVAFDPMAVSVGAGSYSGEVEVWVVEHGARRRMAIPLAAGSGDGCLVARPRFVDFSSGRPECGPRSASVSFENVCTAAITVSSIALGVGNSPGEFTIDAAPAAPFELGAGDDFTVALSWRAATRGPSYTPLFVAESRRAGPLLVPLLASLHEEGTRTDRFVQHRDDAVDLLLVVDNSSSMAEEGPRLTAAVPSIFDAARARVVDLRVAVTTTGLIPSGAEIACPGGVDGGEAGRFFPVDRSRSRVVTSQMANAGTLLAANTEVGTCHYLEQGMEAMRLALSRPLVNGENAGFLRDEARLGVIFVSEEDDHSGFPVGEYADFLRNLKGGGAVAGAIVDTDRRCADASGVAHRYLELAAATGGLTASICERDFTAPLLDIVDRAYTPSTGFKLAEQPDAAGIVVTVDGVVAPPSSYLHDAAANELRFIVSPPPGARIEVTYTPVCR